MKAIIQRVLQADVKINDIATGSIDKGLLVLLGIQHGDSDIQINKMIKKIINLRVFNDNEDKMNLSVSDISGDLLIVSNFTICGNTQKGNRPSYMEAEKPEVAKSIYNDFLFALKSTYPHKVNEGKFQEDMKVSITNDGPVTLIIEV
ncbi:D-aminoacyl-tRNA deacylase [Candidatus Kapabacteria bacterium]|nr:D-aminoacyl-tRNA deacylase [Candidatus Kapabacteria bacterium]